MSVRLKKKVLYQGVIRHLFSKRANQYDLDISDHPDGLHKLLNISDQQINKIAMISNDK